MVAQRVGRGAIAAAQTTVSWYQLGSLQEETPMSKAASISVKRLTAAPWPWSTFQRYQRGQQTLEEEACAENNQHLFDYHIPVADKADF